MLRTFAGTAIAVLLLVAPQAQTTATTIRVWKVGSPHTGDTPHTRIPPTLAREIRSRGWRLTVTAFPAEGFARRFFAARREGSAPDLLVFDNFGIMDGITTELGSFDGVGQDPVVRKQFIQVTGSFDELLVSPPRGWTFLFAGSTSHAAARDLAVGTPQCGSVPSARSLPGDIPVSGIAAAYLAGDYAGLLPHADPEWLSISRLTVDAVTVGGVAVCSTWGNERLAFVTVNASYQTDAKIGQAALLLGFRKIASQWRLLVAARDPHSNREFVAELPILSKALLRASQAGPVPTPATLRSPQSGRFPLPTKGARFGDFEWRSSTSEDVVAEIAEFSYGDDARLFLLRPPNAEATQRVSAGKLWTTGGEWSWRVWSIDRSGEIAFSEVRRFEH